MVPGRLIYSGLIWIISWLVLAQFLGMPVGYGGVDVLVPRGIIISELSLLVAVGRIISRGFPVYSGGWGRVRKNWDCACAVTGTRTGMIWWRSD